MEIRPVSGLTIKNLPNGKKAIVMVVTVSPKTAARIAKALINQTPDNGDKK